MIKKNKGTLFITSLIILLPILAGILLWDHLPSLLSTHWGISGNPDSYLNRGLAVFAMPVFILLAHWFCIFVTFADPKNKNQTKKATRMTFWICPILSLFANGIIYASAFGMEFGGDVLIRILMGLMFAVIGNYLPKCKQNFTLGIKTKWALENEENWNATHRFSGKVWVIGGLLLAASVFLPHSLFLPVSVLFMIVLVVIPFLYSYGYHRKQLREGTAEKNPMSKPEKRFIKASFVFVAVIFICVGILLFSGNIRMQYDASSFTIKASYWRDLTIDYEAIENIEYRQQRVDGGRTSGFGSPRLLMGSFENSEFGTYTRYTYTRCDPAVVLTVNGKTLVISGTDEKDTQAIYDKLLTKARKFQ